jgi:site-specific DNA-methyltransferase (adenine-specific)
MKPYYKDDSVVIYHGDCREIMPTITADVLVTDPPYGTQFSADNPKGGYGRRQNAGLGPEGFTIANDGDTDTRDEMLALWGNERPALVFGSPRLAEPPGRWDHRLVWDKKRPGMNGGPWRYRHEMIFVRGDWARVSDASVSVLTSFPDQSEHIHAKPLDVMLALVGAAPAGVVIDPFAGSGTTLRAAKDLGRKAIGIELEERYCEIAARRMGQEVLDIGGAV